MLSKGFMSLAGNVRAGGGPCFLVDSVAQVENKSSG